MPTLTAVEVAKVAAFATPAGSTVAEWVAKARQESSFQTDRQDYLLSGHWGLWQIDEDHYGKPGMPEASSKADFVSKLKTPGGNWQAARALFLQSGWAPWRASGGKPTPSRADAEAEVAAGLGGGFDPVGGVADALDSLNPFDTVEEVLGAFLDPVLAAAKWFGNPHNWLRVVQVAGGVGLGFVAVTILLRPQIEDAAKIAGGIK